MGKYIGESVLRKEDPRLVTGEAKYLEDIQLSGMVHAVVKRSDYAHAKIKNIDTSEAEKMPGVLGVCKGKDFEDLNPMPCAWQAGGITNNANTPRVLEIDKVTFTGQGVAVVVAEDRNLAEDACSKINVTYEELPVVVSAEDAIKPEPLNFMKMPQITSAWNGNAVIRMEQIRPSVIRMWLLKNNWSIKDSSQIQWNPGEQ